MKPSSLLRRLTTLALGLSVVVVFGLALTQRDLIVDSWQAYWFTPTSAVAAIPSETGMNEHGARLFLASQPVLSEAEEFNRACQSTEQNSMVIGCYTQRRIYLYAVKNSEINGIEEVTAAHEMLHAAYERLSVSQRRTVDNLLQDQAKIQGESAEFAERMQAYQSLNLAERLNEYHSIFGTEVRNLDGKLEDYYRQYFIDRQRTVALYEQYATVFAELKQDTTRLAKSLDRLAQQINQRSAEYRQASSQLSIDIDRFNSRAARGEFNSEQDFQAQRSQLVYRSQALDSEYRQIAQLTVDYKRMEARYDAVALHINQLTDSLDSSLKPAPQL